LGKWKEVQAQKAKDLLGDIIIIVPSTYNIIMARPLINSLKVTLSTYNLGIQYIADNGCIGRIMGN